MARHTGPRYGYWERAIRLTIGVLCWLLLFGLVIGTFITFAGWRATRTGLMYVGIVIAWMLGLIAVAVIAWWGIRLIINGCTGKDYGDFDAN